MTAYKDKFHLQGGEIIRQVTFGMNDGVVSIFALLAGIVGAGQNAETILVTLMAAAVAGALSMAAGEYISGKSEKDYFNHEINQERLEVKLCPEIEKEELRHIYRSKGFSGQLLEDVVDQLTKDEDLWVREMVIDELGTTELNHENEIKPAIVIFFSFLLGASFSVLPYMLFTRGELLNPQQIFYIATGLTVSGLFISGALKKFVTGVNWLKSGAEMLVVGLFAYGISYVVGTFFNV